MLAGKVALITGAAGGLGSAIALGLAEAGASVAVHDLDPAASHRAAEPLLSLGRPTASVNGDVRDAAQVAAFVDEAERALGPIDILVNNAGVMDTTPFLELDPQTWDRVLRTNLTGYFLTGQRVAKSMAQRGGGSIINVSSTRYTQANAGNAAYCASKGGVHMLTKVMAIELAPLGIRVNAIAPGTIRTNLNSHYVDDPEFLRRRLPTIPAGRIGDPQDVVGAVRLLCSPDAGFIVGATIMVDGGQTLG